MKKILIMVSVLVILVLGLVAAVFIQTNIRPGTVKIDGVMTPSLKISGVPSNSAPAVVAPTQSDYVPYIEKSLPPSPTATFTPLPPATLTPTLPASTATPPATSNPILESFEGVETSWKVTHETTGGGSAVRSNALAQDGLYSALLTTVGVGAKAQLRTSFSDISSDHFWGERPGKWYWQRTSVYVPASTVQQLGAGDFLTLAGLYPSAGGTFGWWLRLRQGGALFVYGYTADGLGVEFPVYATIPTNQWVELSLGLHSQGGPGVKRAFAFLINGNFYGWYHQGHMQTETYDRAVFGILDTNTIKPLQVYVDSWRTPSTGQFPEGPDNRSSANLQEQNYRLLSGIQWQMDWSTWKNDLRLDAAFGLFSASERLQSGRNLDRMPDLTNGWAEIEMDWPKGTPPTTPTSYFAAMVGFRKEINQEENFEVIPIGRGGGAVDLVLEAWVNGGPVEVAKWPLPDDNANNIHIPGAGDIIRVKWQQINTTQMTVWVSYFDASKNTWNQNVIITTVNDSNIGGVNFNDGYHKASSVTTDSIYYSIRRFKVGTIDTAP